MPGRPLYDLGVVGGGVAVQMALPALIKYGDIAIHYQNDTLSSYPQFEYFDDLDALLRPEVVKAIYIATPVLSHIDILRRASMAKIPALVEKPLAARLEDVTGIDDNETVAVAFRKRYSEVARAIRIARSEERNLASDMKLTWLAPHPGVNHWKARSRMAGGGVTLDIASHVLDLIEYSLCPIVDLRLNHHILNYADNNADQYLDLELTLEDQSRVYAQVGWATGDPVQCLTLHHGETRLYWMKDANSPDSVLYKVMGSRSERLECRRIDEYQRMLTDFKGFCVNGESGSLARWKDGVRNLQLVSQIFDQIGSV